MCASKATVFCLCSNPHVVMCFDHLKNHTVGHGNHRFRDLKSHNDLNFIASAKNTLNSIKNHIILITSGRVKEEAKHDVVRAFSATNSYERIQTFQKINQKYKNHKIQTLQSLYYIEDLKKKVSKLSEWTNGLMIDKALSSLMNVIILDNFIENKLKSLQKANGRRLVGIEEISINNFKYQGETKNHLAEGRGVCKDSDGSVYEGEFKEGRPEGKGICKYPDGTLYDGEYKGGLQEGRGTFQYASGDFYHGEFKRGEFEGIGFYNYSSGTVYYGEFKHGQAEGRGVFKQPDGTVYEGEVIG